jgi:plastocyanin
MTAAPSAIVARAGTAAGAIAGTITTKEPERPAVRATIDPGVCGSSVPDESITRDAAGHLANVIIIVPGAKAPAPADVLVSNDRCRFVPHVALLRPGGAIRMTSQDAVLHTMHAAGSDGRAFFNVSLPIPKMTLSRTVDRPGPVTLSCSTHTWMRGYLYVTDELAAVSGADGRFRLEGVPAGTHELRIWHEALKASAPVKVTIKDGETATVDITMIR